ncbi:YhdH/YhfP family quinone oxidoreductase [Pseudohongiella spirulinae]|uniref:Oxidoreductase n=1 Tax=Pseudohongiella spirulinae TaxID=1249552 RepID=A0A0S2KCT2_9GAMM|nr:YhdH/YhfP family quinone oxidoreductase [Pseudohongiella spirulinae]ALO46113.1 Oxidoreductase [Pseudohongiella spirulinae]
MELDQQDFRALRVSEQTSDQGKATYSSQLVTRKVAELPEGEVLIRVAYSSLNYKDALSARGNKGVTRQYPHTPGIDAAGIVAESLDPAFQAGDQVIVIGYDLGMNTDGGFGQFIRVPASWIVKKPAGLSLEESMIIGTAGFTAALCVEKLLLNGLHQDQGPVLVTGASGGVGSFAVALLSQLGFQVTAMTGSESAQQFLRELGATELIGRENFQSVNPRPLLKEQWAGAVDAVGGDILFNVVKSLRYGGSVACCGLVASPNFEASVFPFILRGVNLLGVDSVNLPIEHKRQMWNKLAGNWKPAQLRRLHSSVKLEDLSDALDQVFQGRSTGRLVLSLHD